MVNKATPEVQAFIDRLTIQSKGSRYEELFLQTLNVLKGADGEESCSALTDLKLDFCNIEDADIVNLVAMLKEAKYHNQSVTHLNLSSNKVGDAGIQALVIAVAGDVLPGLKTLHLQGNEFTQVGSNMLKGLALMRKNLSLSV